MTSDQLSYENRRVLDAVQALYGAITPQMLAITLEAERDADAVWLHIAASDRLDEELVDDIAIELNALAGPDCDVSVDQWVGEQWWDRWPHRMARPVYAAHVDDVKFESSPTDTRQ